MKIIDLSRSIYSGMQVYPGDPPVDLTIQHNYKEQGWQLRKITMGSHTGTHVDAFSHMHAGKATIDLIPVERFFGRAQVVRPEDNWPQKIGLFFIEEIDVTYLNKLLQSKPNFAGGKITEDLERALLAAEIVTYTDLVNLEQLPIATDFTFYGFPLKIKDGDGSPVRAIAMFD